MPRFVIFDMDGTLIDTVDFHAESWERAFRRFGKEVPLAEIRSQIGKGSDEFLPVFWGEEELRRVGDEMKDYRRELFEREYMPRIKPFPGVRELFQRLQADGKAVALASSSEKDHLETFKKIARIDDLIDAHTSADDAERSKPHPDIFEAALERLGNPDPREAVAVGDTPYDAEAAGKAGLRTIGVLCGGFPAEDLRKAGCVALYRDPADLLEQYDRSPLTG